MEVECGMVVATDWGGGVGGNGKVLVKGCKVSDRQDDQVLEIYCTA